MELVLSMNNVHSYFPLKNLGKKSVHYTGQQMVINYLDTITLYLFSLKQSLE